MSPVMENSIAKLGKVMYVLKRAIRRLGQGKKKTNTNPRRREEEEESSGRRKQGNQRCTIPEVNRELRDRKSRRKVHFALEHVHFFFSFLVRIHAHLRRETLCRLIYVFLNLTRRQIFYRKVKRTH